MCLLLARDARLRPFLSSQASQLMRSEVVPRENKERAYVRGKRDDYAGIISTSRGQGHELFAR